MFWIHVFKLDVLFFTSVPEHHILLVSLLTPCLLLLSFLHLFILICNCVETLRLKPWTSSLLSGNLGYPPILLAVPIIYILTTPKFASPTWALP